MDDVVAARAQALSLARCTSAVMIGVARIVCAITMAVGVKSSERKPSGPERERARYSTRPTTTGGNPKNALIKTTTSRRPRKGKIARAVPMGKLMAVAAAVAAKLTLIDSATISKKLCNSLMVMMVPLRATAAVAADHRILLNLRWLQHGDR